MKYLELFKIPKRPIDDILKNKKSQLAYGERLVRGKVVPFEKEQNTIRLMKKLRVQGLSFGKIAKHLNEQGAPSKNGKHWSARTVWKIFRK